MRATLVTELLSEVISAAPNIDVRDMEAKFTSVLSSYHVERTGTELVVADPIPNAARHYISSRIIEGYSEVTIRSYRNLLGRFFFDLNLPLHEIDAIAIKMWLYNVKKRGLKDTTIAGYQRIISAFFSWCVTNDHLEKNPCKKISNIKCEKHHKHALSAEELAAVRDACLTLKERTLVELLYSTGCRIREFVSIKRSDIELDKNIIHAHNWKSRKDKTVYVSELCRHYLIKYLKETEFYGEYLFYHSGIGGKKPMDIRSVERLVSKIGERAGLPKGRLHPHLFRHTLATAIVSNGGSLSDAQMVLDHARPETTLIYAEISKTQIQEVHRRCVA